MKHVKLFEAFILESTEEKEAKSILQDLLGEYDPWELGDMTEEEAEETVDGYGHKGSKAKKIAKILFDLASNGIFEAVQYKTLDDDSIKTADIHKWIVGQSYQVGKRFPATKAKTRQEKIDIILDPAFQQAYTNYHQTYFEDLQRQWEGMCNSNLPSRGVTPESTKEYKEDLFDALEAWITRENGILDAIKEIGFESFAANEIMGIRHKKSLKLKRKY